MRTGLVFLYFLAAGAWSAAAQAINAPAIQTEACINFHADVVRQLQSGKLAEAHSALSKAQAEPESVLGETCVWMTLHDMATVLAFSGRLAEAEAFAVRALKNLDKWYAPRDPIRFRALQVLSSVQFEQGKRGKAAQAYRVMRSLHIDQAQDRAIIYGLEAMQLQADRRYPDAEREYLRSIAAWNDAERGETMDAAQVFNGLGSLYLEQERYRDAAVALDRALAIASSAKEAVPTDRIKILQVRAVLNFRQRKWHSAAEDLRHAISIADQEARLDPPALKTMLANYALALRKADRKSEARSVEARAAAIFSPEWSKAIVDVTELRIKH